MSYNTDHLRTAGKITVYTSLFGVLVFAFVFIFNLGTAEIRQADAQQFASTTVTVVNTPPYFTLEAIEDPGSTTTNPTNVGDQVTWTGVAVDSNASDYYMLICEGSAAPSATSGGAPNCNGSTQWAVSAAASSSGAAVAATTTTAVAPFTGGDGESFVWYAWVCDADSVDPKCSATSTQGRFVANASSSSPFQVNHRPTFSAYTNTSPGDPGATVFFYSTSTDPDSAGGQDGVALFVCSTNAFDSVNDTCSVTTLASTTAFVPTDASSTYGIPIPLRDTTYGAWGFVIDEHGFEATGGSQGTDSVLTVSNVAPTVPTSTLFLNAGSITLSEAASQTPNFSLTFLADDNNTCLNTSSTTEITSFALSIYRNGTGNSSTTCTTALGDYDPNNCYPSGATSTGAWNLVCTASSTTCDGGPSDTDILYECTFPLWYIADATAGGAFYETDDWRAQVQAIDDDGASGVFSELADANAAEVNLLQAFALNTPTIPYGALEPGQQTDPIVATTTIAATGNVGLDTNASGTSMCTNYSTGNPCNNSSSSTIPASEQVFATSTVAYASAIGSLSSTTGQEIEINVPKSTSTSTPTSTNAYWGIRIPGTISFAGNYTGENVFFAVTGEIAEWQ